MRLALLLIILDLFLLTKHTNAFLVHPSLPSTRANSARLNVSKSSQRIWRERADPNKHHDYMHSDCIDPVRLVVDDNMVDQWVYFARLDSSFCFSFCGISQVHQCRDYFSQTLHPSTMRSGVRCHVFREHPWYCRLPKGVLKKRTKVLALMDQLLEQYGQDRDVVRERRRAVHEGFESRTRYSEDLKKSREQNRVDVRKSLVSDLNRVSDLRVVTENMWKHIDETADPSFIKDARTLIKSWPETVPKVLSKIDFPTKQAQQDRPLSKFRRKRLHKQQQEDVGTLKGLVRPMRSLTVALEDAVEVVEDLASTSGFKNRNQLLNELLHELESSLKATRPCFREVLDYLWAFEEAMRPF